MIVCNCAKPILVLVRKNDVVEYRVTGISTSDAQLGLINYKGNWKTESKTSPPATECPWPQVGVSRATRLPAHHQLRPDWASDSVACN